MDVFDVSCDVVAVQEFLLADSTLKKVKFLLLKNNLCKRCSTNLIISLLRVRLHVSLEFGFCVER